MSITVGPFIWASADNSMYIPLVLLGIFFVWHRARKLHAVVQILAGTHMHRVISHLSFGRQRIKNILLCFGLLFLFIALLRPQRYMHEEKRMQEGRDLLIALDISRSMLATDCSPDRLSYAKEKIKQLVLLLDCDRVGLILFSGASFTQCPLTADRGAFFMFLNQIDVETISSGSTSIDQALNEAIVVFKSMPERKNKLVVVFTDGEDFSSNLAGIKRDSAAIGMHVITVGIGTQQGAPIPLYDKQGALADHQRDDKGAVVISKVNEGILQNLARDCGGVYVRTAEDGSDMNTVMRYVQSFEREKLAETSVATAEESYHYFAGASFICFAVAWLL